MMFKSADDDMYPDPYTVYTVYRIQPVTDSMHTFSSWLHWIRRLLAISNMAGQEDPVQREIHQDWANREYIEVITSSIKKIADFLNSFGKHLKQNITKNVIFLRRVQVSDHAS